MVMDGMEQQVVLVLKKGGIKIKKFFFACEIEHSRKIVDDKSMIIIFIIIWYRIC